MGKGSLPKVSDLNTYEAADFSWSPNCSTTAREPSLEGSASLRQPRSYDTVCRPSSLHAKRHRDDKVHVLLLPEGGFTPLLDPQAAERQAAARDFAHLVTVAMPPLKCSVNEDHCS